MHAQLEKQTLVIKRTIQPTKQALVVVESQSILTGFILRIHLLFLM